MSRPTAFLPVKVGSWAARGAERARHLGEPGPWWFSLTLIDRQTLHEGSHHISCPTVYNGVLGPWSKRDVVAEEALMWCTSSCCSPASS